MNLSVVFMILPIHKMDFVIMTQCIPYCTINHVREGGQVFVGSVSYFKGGNIVMHIYSAL